MNNITKTKTILEAKESSDKNDPLVYSYHDIKGKSMLGHMDLHTAVSLYDFDPKTLTDNPDFYKGKILAAPGARWSGKKVFIQISNHSKHKK